MATKKDDGCYDGGKESALPASCDERSEVERSNGKIMYAKIIY